MPEHHSLEDFYRVKPNWLPENLRQDIGHFTVFRLENYVGPGVQTLATDKVVLSMETNVFGLVSEYKKVLKVPEQVAWVNPTDYVAACVAWIEGEAIVGKARCVPVSI
jgi:hypothetical protein